MSFWQWDRKEVGSGCDNCPGNRAIDSEIPHGFVSVSLSAAVSVMTGRGSEGQRDTGGRGEEVYSAVLLESGLKTEDERC